MLSAVTSCLSTSGKIMSAWHCWLSKRADYCFTCLAFFRRALNVCQCTYASKQSHVCMQNLRVHATVTSYVYI